MEKHTSDSDPLGIDVNIDFSSVGGLDHYINQLKEMVYLPLMYPEVYKRFSITPLAVYCFMALQVPVKR